MTEVEGNAGLSLVGCKIKTFIQHPISHTTIYIFYLYIFINKCFIPV